MMILGVDPGYAIVGFGFVRYMPPHFVPVEYGSIVTKAGVPFENRLEIIFRRMVELFDKRKPDALAIAICHGQNCKVIPRTAATNPYNKKN